VAAVKLTFAASFKNGLKDEVIVTIFGAEVSPALLRTAVSSLFLMAGLAVVVLGFTGFLACACTAEQGKKCH
jgi:amino acid transporter